MTLHVNKVPVKSPNLPVGRVHSLVIAALLAFTMIWSGAIVCHAGGETKSIVHHWTGPVYFVPKSKNRTMLEARTGYLWGVNALWFRDGDNDNTSPGKKEISLESPLLGIQGEARFSDDLAVRAQGWINYPQTRRGDSVFDRTPAGTLTARSWDTQSRYLAADLSLVYHLGPFGKTHFGKEQPHAMPYSAGLVGGYRYINLDYTSTRASAPTGLAEDHFHVHIPYIGVHYANEAFAGSLVRLDLLASPFIISRLDAERQYPAERTQISGQSVTGFWFEALFSWCLQASERGFFGVFATYNYLELSGGATVNRVQGGILNSTRFSLDSISHLVSVGLTGVVTF